MRESLWLILVALTPFHFARPSCAQSELAIQPRPCWIWHSDNSGSRPTDDATESYLFKKTFHVDERIRTARLRMAADFCHLTVSNQGHPIAVVEAFCPTVDIDVTSAMRLGDNRLSVEAQAIPGPHAFALSLEIQTVTGANSLTIISDDSWQASAREEESTSTHPAQSLGKVSEAQWGIGRRSSQIDAIENYEQWRQAETGKVLAENQFWSVPDFKISLVRSALPEEGSWVSMAFDPAGRLTISKEAQGLLRMTLDETDRSVKKVELLNDQLLECRGMVYAHDALYVNANGSKGMYRLRDSNGDDQFDQVEPLRAFPGSAGHGRNDLALGPDGWIYSIHGDAVDLPKSNIVDRTSPFRESRRGQETREGHVVRTDPEGKAWELLCAGLRNPFGIAVNPDGEWFTYDADAEFDMGSPWYRPTRIVHLVPGADYGWRGVTGKWPPYFPDHPDNALPTLDIGRGSPTAVLFGTATRFPKEYRRALFVLDWTYGRILALHLMPRGAGYRASAETFIQGRPLNVTDLAIGPGGAMYLITGGRKTQSALYRIEYVGKDSEKDDLEQEESASHELDAKRNAAVARKLRKQLELGHSSSSEGFELAWRHLNSDDESIRYAARIAIEHKPVELWSARALDEGRRVAAIEAVLALTRSREPAFALPIIDRLLRLPADELQLGEVWSVLHIYSLLLDFATDTVQSKRTGIIDQIESFLPRLQSDVPHIFRYGSNSQVRRAAMHLMAELGAESTVSVTAQSLFDSPEQEDQLQALFVLRNVKSGWSDENRREYFRLLDAGSRFVSGEGMPKFLNKIREEAVASLTGDQRVQFADLIHPSVPEPEPLPPARPFVKRWTTAELLAELSTSEHVPDKSRGEIIFRDALCIRCHRKGARGPAVGPDLTHIASRFSRRDLIDSITSPSNVIAESYRNVQIATVDGRVIVGSVVVEGDYRSQKLQIAHDPLRPTEFTELDKKDIESWRESPISPMPIGLLDSFQLEEIADLLEYLLAGS